MGWQTKEFHNLSLVMTLKIVLIGSVLLLYFHEGYFVKVFLKEIKKSLCTCTHLSHQIFNSSSNNQDALLSSYDNHVSKVNIMLMFFSYFNFTMCKFYKKIFCRKRTTCTLQQRYYTYFLFAAYLPMTLFNQAEKYYFIFIDTCRK